MSFVSRTSPHRSKRCSGRGTAAICAAQTDLPSPPPCNATSRSIFGLKRHRAHQHHRCGKRHSQSRSPIGTVVRNIHARSFAGDRADLEHFRYHHPVGGDCRGADVGCRSGTRPLQRAAVRASGASVPRDCFRGCESQCRSRRIPCRCYCGGSKHRFWTAPISDEMVHAAEPKGAHGRCVFAVRAPFLVQLRCSESSITDAAPSRKDCAPSCGMPRLCVRMLPSRLVVVLVGTPHSSL